MQARPFNYGHGDILSENRKYLLDGSTPVDSTLSSFFPSMPVSFTERHHFHLNNQASK